MAGVWDEIGLAKLVDADLLITFCWEEIDCLMDEDEDEDEDSFEEEWDDGADTDWGDELRG